ncbi:MAG: amylo-alpha-1,6-glucosidase [Anaerolineae bacterium]
MVEIGRHVLASTQSNREYEWLVTNGIGGYASGTVAGMLSRRYHGLLVAALQPPLGRTVLVSKCDETVVYSGQTYEIFTNQWQSANNNPTPPGYFHLNRFYLDGTSPVWEYAIADALLEKRLWMAYGENTTYLQYRLLRASAPLNITSKITINYKVFHANTHANGWQMALDPVDQGVRVTAFDGAVPFYLVAPDAALDVHHDWYHNYYLALEAYRGLDAEGDHLHALTVSKSLQPGKTLDLVFTTNLDTSRNLTEAWTQKTLRDEQLLVQSQLVDEPDWIRQLVLAADQFIVKRETADHPDGRSVIAGYHWFGDWGRDTMISLPGLTLATGRTDEAAAILRTFGQYVDQGMLPNRFPDNNETPEYNTVDATLWYFEALRQYHEATGDEALIAELFPVLQSILDWHLRGTRYNIHVDESDGLLYSGEAGVQLTWMDAKVGDWVITPRTGKAVEINALWYNALKTMVGFADLLNKPGQRYADFAVQVEASFSRFWNDAAGYCFDVIDTPTGNDLALRPNQLFAVSLHHSPLPAEQQKAIVDTCARHLLTPHGLRSLAPSEDAYISHYGGDPVQRDRSYHQGTVWAWLIGPFVDAHLRVYGDRAAARSFLQPFKHHLEQQCVGTIAEIFDADPPFTPRGAVAQAWSVAEVLRAWLSTAVGIEATHR